ncbi:MAG: LytR/AlgR family response regulator transcription factor, partial [Culicoidibacterales bacterium]
MLKVAICDDIPEIANEIDKILQEYDSSLFETYISYSAKNLLIQLDDIDFDLYIIDIQLAEDSGIEVAQKIREKNQQVPIVFVTSYREYMEEVFQVQTFDYILKPLEKERIFLMLDRIKSYLEISDNVFFFTYNKIMYRILHSQIIYFEKNKRQVKIYTKNQMFISNMSTF